MSKVNRYFDVDIAKDVGTDSAIILYNIEFWIEKNKANNKHFYDGRYWTYNSVRAFDEQFVWLTKSKIRTCLEKLVEKGYLITGNYNKNKYDRTIWYSTNDESSSQNNKIDLSKLANGFEENHEPIPYINTDNKTHISIPDKSGDTPLKSPSLAMKYVARFNELYSCRQTLTPTRMKSYKARVKTFGEESILIALENMAAQPFYRGENSRNWVPDIAWLIKNDDNVNKLLSPAKPIKKSLEERLKEEIPDAQIF